MRRRVSLAAAGLLLLAGCGERPGYDDSAVEAYLVDSQAGKFGSAEGPYRLGFVSALHPDHRGSTYAACKAALCERHGEAAESEVFRRGFERGLRHGGAFAEGRGGAPGRSAGGSKPTRPAQT